MSSVDIHQDVQEIISDAESSTSARTSIASWTPEQKAVLERLLEYAWNRGYKGCLEDEA